MWFYPMGPEHYPYQICDYEILWSKACKKLGNYYFMLSRPCLSNWSWFQSAEMSEYFKRVKDMTDQEAGVSFKEKILTMWE